MTNSLIALLEESRELGFLGPGPVQPHLDHALAFAEAVEFDPARALDLGAGGGLPGLVLSQLKWSGARWTFLDSQKKRIAFLGRAVEDLQLQDRVMVVADRAEAVGQDSDHRGTYDLVTARSFGPPAVTAECATGLLRPGGVLVVSEPPAAPADRWPRHGLAKLGFGPARKIVVTTGEQPVHLVRIERTAAEVGQYPRKIGLPNKRPLF